MIVRWLPEALNDAREMRGYIAKDNPAAARELGAHFHSAEERIEAFPLLQPEGDIPGIRELVIRRFRCVIVYRIKPTWAEVVWVFGPGQDRAERAKDDPR